MKLIIDINEDVRIAISRMGLLRIPDEMQKKVDEAIQRGTPIPDNATNGDVIKVLYPNADIEIHNITVYVIFDMRSNVISFDLDWWNAPYQKGGKE